MDVEEIAANPAISTHTPHARRDFETAELFKRVIKFQLTRLMRGVTLYLV